MNESGGHVAFRSERYKTEMTVSKTPSPFKRRLEQRHPYLFVEYWKEGERPFNWLAEWRHLTVEISDVRVAVTHNYLSRKFGRDAQPVRLAEFKEDAVPANIPAEQKKNYLEYVSNLFNDSFTSSNSERTYVISGRFRTEEERGIGFIRSGESEEGKPIAYTGQITFYSANDPQPGYLWKVGEDDSKWDSSRKPGEVCIDLYLAPTQIEAAIAEIKQAALADRQIRVTAGFQVLAFQSEVDRALAEPYHHQVFYFQDDAFASAVLERLTIWPVAAQPSPTTAPNGEIPVPETIPLVRPVVESVSTNKQPRYSMKALVIALWAIAVAIVFHALR